MVTKGSEVPAWGFRCGGNRNRGTPGVDGFQGNQVVGGGEVGVHGGLCLQEGKC